jgi:hypothetical protein
MSAGRGQLFGLERPRAINPSSTRHTPAFWVRRLRILHELASGEQAVVRDVELRRGLNIVWAPSREGGSGNALFKDGVAGHTAGKTTFCRLLRHALGEPGFGPDAVRRAIRKRLPTGWIVAEVVVGVEPWVVARPLYIGPHSFCIRGGTVDQVGEPVARHAFSEFLQAIAAVSVGHLPAVRFPASDEPLRWEHVLPWLSRDQECRFADFLEWRHPGSGSEAPALTVDERQFLVRSVLGLISDEERAEQQANARLVAERKEAVRFEPLLRHRAEADRLRLAKALGIEPSHISMPLFASAGRGEIEKRAAAADHRERQIVASDRRADLCAALEEAVSNSARLREKLDQAERLLELKRGTVDQLDSGAQAEVLARLPPPRGFCGVPLSLARDRQCPLATETLASVASARGERTAAQELETHQEGVRSSEEEVRRLVNSHRAAEEATSIARRAFLSETTAHDQARTEVERDRGSLAQLGRMLDDAEEAARQATEQVDVIARLDRQIADSYARQDELRRAHRAALARFSARFDLVVRAILGEQVVGRVDATGRSVTLVAEEHGERESAAVATVKLIAFDFAALVASVEGDGEFPRFLIHDGPREADLSADIYERLFLSAREIEHSCGTEPSFQYIITTTTRPPGHLVAKPWLCLQLAGAPAEQRLLKCDL